MAVESQETMQTQKPNKGNKRFWTYRKEAGKCFGQSLSALFLHFPPDICCLAGPCLVLQVWHALKSDKCKVLGNLLLLQLAALKVQFFFFFGMFM